MWGGSSYPIIRYMMGYISPMDLLAITFIPATVFALILLPILYNRKVLTVIKRYWWFFLLNGSAVLFGFHYMVNYIETIMPAAATTLIVSIWPIITVWFGAIFLRESVSPAKVIGAFIAFAGAAVLILYGARSEASAYELTSSEWIRYSVVSLIIPLVAAGVTIASKWFLTHSGYENGRVDTVMYSLLMRLPTGFMILALWKPSAFIENVQSVPNMTLFILLVTVLATGRTGGFMLWNWALKQIEAGNTAIFSYMGTLISVIASWLFLNEQIGVPTVIALVGIFSGVVIANHEKWRKDVPKDTPPAQA